jgi:hypothetical protein
MTGTTTQPGAPAPGTRRPQVPGRGTVLPAPGTGAARDMAARRARGVVDKARASLRGSPGQLRVAGIAAVVACLAFAGLATWALQIRAGALSAARDHAAQLVRVQQIASDLVAADSQFTNGYLTFGQDSTAQLNAYDAAIAEASRLIAQASRAEPADAPELATVNDALSQYTARVAAARANNKQGFQVGVGYLRQASDLLRSDKKDLLHPDTQAPNLLPTLDRLVSDNAGRVDDAFAASRLATWVLVGAGVLGLGSLIYVQVWLARRSHRFLNLPLAAATVAVVVALAAGGAVMIAAQSKANQVKDNSYAATLALANARIAAYVGKSYQSIALIYVGTGGDYPTYQNDFKSQVDTAKKQLAAAAAASGADVGSTDLQKWVTAGDQLYAAAQNDWVSAATSATRTTPGSVNALFAAFDQATRPALATRATAAEDGLSGSNGALVVLGWLALLLGLVAAGLSWLGVSLRLEEYR